MTESGGHKQQPLLVAPDGGWGWMIVVAYAVCNIVIAPTVGSFGLIFNERRVLLGLTATDVALITNVNVAVGMSMGLVNGPLLRRFGCRSVGVAGGVLMAVGVCLTAAATSMAAFLVFYGLVAAIGMGISMSAFSLSLNQYFQQRRNRAIGIGMTLTGLGPILYPPLIAALLLAYGTAGCVLILGALCAHIVCAALLLDPIEWHRRPAPPVHDIEMLAMNVTEAEADVSAQTPPVLSRSATVASKLIDAQDHIDTQSIYGVDQVSCILPLQPRGHPDRQHPVTGTSTAGSLSARRGRPVGGLQFERSISHVMQRRPSHHDPQTATATTPTAKKPFLRWFESGSVASVHLGSSVDVFGGEDGESRVARSPRPSVNGRAKQQHRSMASLIVPSPSSMLANPPQPAPAVEAASDPPNLGQRLVGFFDLQLFADPVYVNIMIGMSLAIFAELNFTIMTPFLLHDWGYSTAQIASCLSVLAGADLVARFAAPFVGERLGVAEPRILYMGSLLMLIAARLAILFVTRIDSMLVVCLALGLAKGLRTVYMQLVLPAYVPLDQLAAAAGLQMVVNGLLIMALGPLVGLIRDWTGSYAGCILFLNSVTAITLSMWSVEFVRGWWRRRKSGQKPEMQSPAADLSKSKEMVLAS